MWRNPSHILEMKVFIPMTDEMLDRTPEEWDEHFEPVPYQAGFALEQSVATRKKPAISQCEVPERRLPLRPVPLLSPR